MIYNIIIVFFPLRNLIKCLKNYWNKMIFVSRSCFLCLCGMSNVKIEAVLNLFKAGKPIKRQDSSGFTFCAKSCQGDLCNLRSCQLDNTTRSPRCLSCIFVNAPQECQNVVKCKANEVCYAEKYTTFQKIKYRLGCVCKADCDVHPISTTTALIGKRSDTDKCSVCCKSDYCNLNACGTPEGPVFKLKPLSPGDPCDDTDPAVCSTLGRLNADSCIESSIIKLCPKSCVACDHVGWMPWQPWSTCSKTCNEGTRTRSRICKQRYCLVDNVPCKHDAVEREKCLMRHCPVNGGWCYKEQCIPRQLGSPVQCSYCGFDCIRSTVRDSCDCPTPKYGGSSC